MGQQAERHTGLLEVGGWTERDRRSTAADDAGRRTASDPPGGRLGHVEGLDGLRAVAVVAVLAFHGGITWLPGGFLGVDVFFVLSGFLITTLLLEEVDEQGGVDLRRFWTRRIRRLLPALVLVVAAVVAVPWLTAPDRAVSSLRIDAAAALAYVANWRYVLSGGSYFERTGTPSPLLHMWSLAVEEQFYLVWPVVVGVVARRARHAVAAVAAVGAMASVVAMAVLFRPDGGSRAYYGTDTRVHVILVGALLATVLHRTRDRDASAAARGSLALAAVAGAGLVGVSMVTATGDDAWLYRGGFAAVALATAAMIASAVVAPQGPVGAVLSVQPLPAIGRISYGLYLWHWPVFLALTGARTGLRGPALLTARLAATVAAALLSSWLLERPVRTGRLLPGARPAFALAASSVVAAAALLAAAVWLPLDAGGRTGLAARSGALPAGGPTARRPARPAGKPARVMFIGDSVSKTLADGIGPLGPRHGATVVNEAVLGCGVARGGPLRYFGDRLPSPPECEQWPERWRKRIERDDPDVVFVVIGRWEVMDRVRDGGWTHIGTPVFDAYLASEIDTAIGVLAARGATVALATAPYYLRGERPDGGRWPEDDPARVDRFNVLVREAAARHAASTTVVDLNSKTAVGGRYARSVDGVQIRYDGVHFTPQGGRWLAPWLLPQLVALAPPSGAPGAVATTPTTAGPPTTPAPPTTARQRTTTSPPPTTAPATTRPRPSTTRPATTTTLPASTTTTRPLTPLG